MKKILKIIFLILAAALASFVLVFSLSVMNLFVKGNLFREKTFRTTEVRTVRAPKMEKTPKPETPPRKPRQAKSNHRSPKSGPRFAMDLNVAGIGDEGVMAPADLVGRSGGAQESSLGDVDEKPNFRGALPSFEPPQKIRDAERDAVVRISFCVDKSGRVYNARAIEESPAGMGLFEAGKKSLSSVTFVPAKKDGKPVPFCGMEQPFEIRFRD